MRFYLLRNIVILTVIYVLSISISQATTFMSLHINGKENVNMLVQGQDVRIRADCGVGNTVILEIYIDVDGSHTLTPPDILALAEDFVDGDAKMNTRGNVIPDSKIDGVIDVTYKQLWILYECTVVTKIIDMDGSSVTSWFEIKSNPASNSEIKGVVKTNKAEAPELLYQSILVGSSPFLTIPDTKGNFSIGLPPGFEGQNMEVRFIDGGNSGILMPNDIEFKVPEKGGIIDVGTTKIPQQTAWIIGKIKNQHGSPIGPLNLVLSERYFEDDSSSVRQSSDTRSVKLKALGSYTFRVHAGDYELDVRDPGDFQPSIYWQPVESEPLTVAKGDTAKLDILCYEPDSGKRITVKVNRPQSMHNNVFFIETYTDGYYMKAPCNNKTGIANILVSSNLSNEFDIIVFRDNYSTWVEDTVIAVGDTIVLSPKEFDPNEQYEEFDPEPAMEDEEDLGNFNPGIEEEFEEPEQGIEEEYEEPTPDLEE
ncbi:hypothetical protein JXI42_14430 [bacterium]|nr:hypothetical protein [bacterium]